MNLTEHDLSTGPVKTTAWHRCRALLACGALPLALVLTSCGGSSRPSTNVPPPTTSATAASATAAPSVAPSVASSTATSSAAPSVSAGSLTGAWQGTADSSAGMDVIDLTVVFTQQGSSLSGSIETDSVCLRRGTVSGTNNGATADFVAVSGTQKVTFKASSTGRHMQGTYQAVTSCGNDHGKFELSAS